MKKQIHAYIFVDKYNGTRFYDNNIDTGPFCSAYKKLLQGGLV